jgi:hypothetical protein
MNTLATTLDDWTFAPGPFEDHHGGGCWVHDGRGWICLLLPLGIEWSAQFCADPAKVDQLRQLTARVVAAFPDTLPGYLEHNYDTGQELLTTPITTPEDVATWTDSIFNASVPLPRLTHSGTLPHGAGYHHYPKPIVDIDHFRFDDFELFVTDAQGLPAVVVPMAPRGSGDGRVRLIAASPDSQYAPRLFTSADLDIGADRGLMTEPGLAEPAAEPGRGNGAGCAARRPQRSISCRHPGRDSSARASAPYLAVKGENVPEKAVGVLPKRRGG